MKNRTAIITGGAKRIGAAITCELHRMGMDVIIHFNTSGEPASQLVDKLNSIRPGSARAVQSDLGITDNCSELIETALEINNRLDVLINNASAFFPVPLLKASNRDWNSIIDINLKAPFLLSQAAATHLASTKGSIINLTDIHANRPLKNHGLYSVSKAGLIMLTRSLALELAPDVRVNAISPGAIFWHENMTENDKKEILHRIPLKSLGKAEDIAKAVNYLVDGTSYITGEELIIDGGRSLVS